MAVSIISNPKPTSTQNTVRQEPPRVSTAPPTTGAIIGASPPSAIMIDMTRASTSPRATSTITARATTAATPPPNPCTTRNPISHPMDGASAQPTAPAVQTRPPAMIGSRRPRWSDNGPPSSWPSAMPKERGEGQPDQGRRGGQFRCHVRNRRGVHVGRERRHRRLQGPGQDQRHRDGRPRRIPRRRPTTPHRSCRRPRAGRPATVRTAAAAQR